jgi:hypothetical protein
MGVKEQIIFPEIEYDKIDAIRGMNITITTTAKTDDEARRCLRHFVSVQELRRVMAKACIDQSRAEASQDREEVRRKRAELLAIMRTISARTRAARRA